MDDDRLRLAIVIGGGPDRTDRASADWLADRIRRRGGAEVDLIDLAAACLPDARCGEAYGSLPTPPAVRDLTPWLADADGFVVVLGDGPPGPLRDAVEWCAEGWRAKPVAFTWSGAPPDQAQVRTIFAAAPAVTIREALRFDDVHRGHQADLMLDELAWWARPLRAARASTPYPFSPRGK